MPSIDYNQLFGDCVFSRLTEIINVWICLKHFTNVCKTQRYFEDYESHKRNDYTKSIYNIDESVIIKLERFLFFIV